MIQGNQTVVTGTRTTSNVNTTARVRDVSKKVAFLAPYQTPITDFFMSNDWAQKEVKHPRSLFEWYEDAFLPDTVTLVDAIAGGGATEDDIIISANYFLQYDTILIEATGEVASVYAAPDTTNTEINIRRVGGGVLTAAASGTRLQRLVPAFIENSSKQSALTVQTIQRTGNCQILKKGLSMTGRQQAGEYYTGDDWAYQWGKALEEIKEALERMFIYNVAAYDDTTNDITYSAGFNGLLSSNLFTYPADLDESFFDDCIKTVVDNGKVKKLKLYVGSGVVMGLNKFLKAKYELRDSTNSAGTLSKYGPVSATVRRPQVLTYLHPLAELDVIYNPQLKGKYTNSILGFDPSNAKMRFMGADKKGARKFRREMGIETPGADSEDAQYLFDVGLEYRLEETGFWIHKS